MLFKNKHQSEARKPESEVIPSCVLSCNIQYYYLWLL